MLNKNGLKDVKSKQTFTRNERIEFFSGNSGKFAISVKDKGLTNVKMSESFFTKSQNLITRSPSNKCH